MSHHTPGPIGLFNGTTGELVTCRWKNLRIGRSRPVKTKKKASVALKTQRLKMGIISSCLSNLSEVIAVGYSNKSGSKTAMNSAVKYNVKHAIIGVFPELKVDYSKIQLSCGWLDQIYTPSMSVVKENIVQVNWLNSANLKLGADENDTVNLSFYNEKADDKLYESHHMINFKSAALRSVGTVQVNIGQFFKDTIHAWIFLTSADGKKTSNSKYLGSFSLQTPTKTE